LQKALPAAIRAVARVPGVLLAAVSKSPPQAYAALAAAEGVSERVRFVPPTPAVARYYAAADLFLFPTFYDTFGLVIGEAMASGLPVVTSRAAGAAELITHGESGWLTTDPWDADQLADAVRTLAADADLRRRMGVAARAAIEPFTWDRTAAETLAVYRQVAAERPR
jgi:glycosyltransferase involved in cell wall biosynthesis